MIYKLIILWFHLLIHVDSLQPIHLSIVVCGDRLPEAITALKSSLIFTQAPIIFHIFTEDHLRAEFNKRIESEWTLEYRSKFTIDFHSIEYPRGNDQRWRTLFKPCCTQRLFFPELLPSIDSVIYVDTDVIFLSDLRNLWRLFRKFNSTQMAALSAEHEEPAMGWYNRFARHPYYGPMGLNSGVMLMNLTRMRQVNMIDEILEIFDEHHSNITWGDQCLLNIYFHFHPERIYQFACEHNYRPDHCIYENNCKSAVENGIRIVHGCRSAFHNEKYPEFRSIYETVEKWSFNVDLKNALLKPMEKQLEKYSQTHCGKTRDLFVKHLSKEISSFDYSRKNHYHMAFLINNNWNLIDQTAMLIKSVFIFSPDHLNRIHLHVVISNDETRKYFSEQIERQVHRVTYYNTTMDNPLELSTILNVDRAIYVNPSVMFLSSLQKIWSQFDHFNEKQVFGLFGQCQISGFSQLIFLQLDRIRESKIQFETRNFLSAENVYFLPCKFMLEIDDCHSIDDALFLPERSDPALFGILLKTISQINMTDPDVRSMSIFETAFEQIEKTKCRNRFIQILKTHGFK